MTARKAVSEPVVAVQIDRCSQRPIPSLVNRLAAESRARPRLRCQGRLQWRRTMMRKRTPVGMHRSMDPSQTEARWLQQPQPEMHSLHSPAFAAAARALSGWLTAPQQPRCTLALRSGMSTPRRCAARVQSIALQMLTCSPHSRSQGQQGRSPRGGGVKRYRPAHQSAAPARLKRAHRRESRLCMTRVDGRELVAVHRMVVIPRAVHRGWD